MRKGTGAPTIEESSMNTDLRNSEPVGEPASEHTFNAFWLSLNPFRVAPDLCSYL